nr:hypothetical protein [uncultured Rhodopila sp.]
MRRLKALLPMTIVLSAAACSATDPIPSGAFDGRYVGTRQSDQAEACGVVALKGSVSARVTDGHFFMALFSAKTQLTGTVGAGGRVRASGIWANPTGGFPGMTVLNGKIADDVLDGTATDFRCHTEVRLHRVASPPGAPKLRP